MFLSQCCTVRLVPCETNILLSTLPYFRSTIDVGPSPWFISLVALLFFRIYRSNGCTFVTIYSATAVVRYCTCICFRSNNCLLLQECVYVDVCNFHYTDTLPECTADSWTWKCTCVITRLENFWHPVVWWVTSGGKHVYRVVGQYRPVKEYQED